MAQALTKRIEMGLPLGSLEAYIHWVNQIPLLTQDEEYQLANSWQKAQDTAAARKLVLAHLRYVVRIAKNYAGYGLAEADLIQEGNIGLLKAVKRFDPQIGVRLVSFAVHWIKAEIHEFIIRNWRIVKIATTKAQRKVFFNLRKLKNKMHKRLGWTSEQEIQSVAKDLGVDVDVVRHMELRMDGYDVAFDAPADENENSVLPQFAPIHYLEDQRYNPERLVANENWAEQKNTQLLQALEQLDDRSRDIIKARWLTEPKATLDALAQKYQLTAERIRQLEQQALKKLKNLM